MLPPVVCFTCGQVIADKYDYYVQEVKRLEMAHQQPTKNEGGAPRKTKAKEKEEVVRGAPKHFDGILTGQILDRLGLKRYCCRRMMLGTEDMMEII